MANKFNNLIKRMIASKTLLVFFAAIALAGTASVGVIALQDAASTADTTGHRGVTDTSQAPDTNSPNKESDFSVTNNGENELNFINKYDYYDQMDNPYAYANRFMQVSENKLRELAKAKFSNTDPLTTDDLVTPPKNKVAFLVDVSRYPTYPGYYYLYGYDKNGEKWLAADTYGSSYLKSSGNWSLHWSSTTNLLHFRSDKGEDESSKNYCIEYATNGAKLRPCVLNNPSQMWYPRDASLNEGNPTSVVIFMSLYKKNQCLGLADNGYVYSNYSCDATYMSTQRLTMSLYNVPGTRRFYSPTFFNDGKQTVTPWTKSPSCAVQLSNYLVNNYNTNNLGTDLLTCFPVSKENLAIPVKTGHDSDILKRSLDGNQPPNPVYKDHLGREVEIVKKLDPLAPGQSRVYVFGVGQGNFVMFDGYGWEHPVIVDAGSLEETAECNNDGTRRLAIDRFLTRTDAAQIARYLMQPQGANSPIRRPLVFVSHPDRDHSNLLADDPGLTTIFGILSGSRIFPQTIYLGGHYENYSAPMRMWISDVIDHGGAGTGVFDSIEIGVNPRQSLARDLTQPGALSLISASSPVSNTATASTSGAASTSNAASTTVTASTSGATNNNTGAIPKKRKCTYNTPQESKRRKVDIPLTPFDASIDLMPTTGALHGPRINILASNHNSKDPNATSLIVQLTSGDYSVITSGDAVRAAEAEAIRTATRLRSLEGRTQGIWIGSHHGADTDGSNSLAFADTVQPAIIIFSTGNHGVRYGHPRSSNYDRLINHVMSISEHLSATKTDKDNTVTWTYKKNDKTGEYEQVDLEKKAMTADEKKASLSEWEFDMMSQAIFNTRENGSMIFTLTPGGAYSRVNNADIATRNVTNFTRIQLYMPGNLDRSEVQAGINQIIQNNIFETSASILANFNNYVLAREPADRTHPLFVTDAATAASLPAATAASLPAATAASLPAATAASLPAATLDQGTDLVANAVAVIAWYFANQVGNSKNPWGKSK